MAGNTGVGGGSSRRVAGQAVQSIGGIEGGIVRAGMLPDIRFNRGPSPCFWLRPGAGGAIIQGKAVESQ